MNKNLITIGIALILISCSSKNDPVTGEKVLIEPNPNIKTREFVEKEGSIFGNITGQNKNKGSAIVEFGNSNVLWKATLQSIDFIPIANLDYAGGMIVYDWYSENENSDEQIKIQIRFLSNEVRSDSLEINVHKKKCDISNRCSQILLKNSFPQDIKDSILTKARQIKIEDEKSKKN